LGNVRAFLAKSFRFRFIEPIRYGAELVRTCFVGDARPLRLLLLSDQASYTSEQQFAPLLAQRRAIRERLGVVFHRQLVSDALLLPKRALLHYDVVGLKLGFRTPASEAARIARFIKEGLAAHAKMVYFDGDDDLGVQWPHVLSAVDLYVKKHCFRDRNEYRRARIGKTNLTDYVARTFGTSFAQDLVPSSEPLDATQLGKIVAAWNIGLDEPIRRLHARHPTLPPASSKDVDVVCRATVNPRSWLYPLRSGIISKIASLADAYRVLTPDQRVTQDVYYQEMLRSRICVSPFGYGEICWRDFEAVLCGCVLVKPDMSHVQTEPDIFVPGETYVPVRWDYADLVPTLQGLLAQPERCERLRANAFRALSTYLAQGRVLDAFQRILNALRVGDAAVRVAA
jgi:hypothetical protein